MLKHVFGHRRKLDTLPVINGERADKLLFSRLLQLPHRRREKRLRYNVSAGSRDPQTDATPALWERNAPLTHEPNYC